MAWWTLLSPPHANDIVGGDEGYYGVMARNILASPLHWPAPSLTPLGAPGDKPPLYPALIALALSGFGMGALGVRAVSIVATFVTLWSCAVLARRAAGNVAGWAALALLGTLPWLADASRVAAAELPLAAFGLLALLVMSGGEPTLRRGAAAGALFGAAFLCKLWLVMLPGLPALLMALPDRRRRLGYGVAIGFVTVVGAHLALLALLAPEHLQLWWNVAWTFSLASRAGGQGYAAYWLHGPEYYVRAMAHALAATIPLLMLGTLHAAAGNARPISRALLGSFAGLLLLSLFRVKSGGYAYPLVPLFGILAAVGFAELYAGFPTWPTPLPARVPRMVGWALLAGAVIVGGSRVATRLPQRYHDTGYADIAAALTPRMVGAEPARVALIAPEAPAFAFLLFRTVEYWDTPYRPWSRAHFDSLVADTNLRAIIVDPTQRFYGGWPDSSALQWLVHNKHEVTADIERASGRTLELRVFVPR